MAGRIVIDQPVDDAERVWSDAIEHVFRENDVA